MSSNNLLPSLHTRDISTVMEHFEKCHYKHWRNITNWARGNWSTVKLSPMVTL